MNSIPSVFVKKSPEVPVIYATPGSRCSRFFTRYVKQAGALPSESAVPWRKNTGAWHITPWTRAPFFEMWGKPKSCRDPQEICHYYTDF